MSCVIGVDVGGTKVAAAAIEDAQPSASSEEPTDLSGPQSVLDGIAAAVGRVVDQRGEDAAAVGIGLPSQIEYATGTVVSSVNIPLEGVAVREVLEQRLGVPVFVDNDANVAALGEAQLGDGSPVQSLVMLTLGTGVGGGIISGGRIERGAVGLGAEVGHVIVDGEMALADHELGFPRPGSLEWFCSGTGLERSATAVARADPGGALGRLLAATGRVSGRDAVELAEGGDVEARAVFDRLGRWLGLGIASFVNTFGCERVAIGGGLSRASALFLDAALEEAARNCLPALWQRTTVYLARGGPDAGLIGAGVLAQQELERSRDTANT